MTYFREFKSDPLDSILKYGSLPQRSRSPWFTDLRAVESVLSLPDQVCGPRSERTDPLQPARSLVGAAYKESEPGSERSILDGLSPNFYCQDQYYWHVHIDLGLGKKRQGDAAGIAMGRIAESYAETGVGHDMRRYQRIVRTYEVPLAAEIVAPVGDQIYLSSIVRFILQLKQLRGFNITSFSSDQFQSAGSAQELMLAGLVTSGMSIDPATGEPVGLPRPFSVDRTDGPYRELLEVVNENRIRLPNYEHLRKQMRELEYVGPGHGPDHPVMGQKDVADPVAGVVGYLATYGHAELSIGQGEIITRQDMEQRGMITPAENFGVEGDDDPMFDIEPAGAISFVID
jgi:hypothetical protein